MKKFLMLFFLTILSLSSVNALELVTDTNGFIPIDKTSNTNQIYMFDGTNFNSNANIDILRNKVFVEPRKTLITTSILNNDDITHLFQYNANSLSGGIAINVKFINISPNEQRDFAILTTKINEEVDIYFKCLDCVNNSLGSYSYNYQILDKTIITYKSNITDSFVGAMNDLININIGFWKIFYYLFIFSIILGTIGLLVSFGFKIYTWADDISHKKKQIFTGGHSNNNNNNNRNNREDRD